MASILCRLCALNCNNYLDVLAEEGKKENLVDKTKKCLQILIDSEDILPKTICLDCAMKLDDFLSFYDSCHQTQISLTEIYKKEIQPDDITSIIDFPQEAKADELLVLNGFNDRSLDFNVDCILLDNRGVENTTEEETQIQPSQLTPIRPQPEILPKSTNDEISTEDLQFYSESRSESQDDDRSDRDDGIFYFCNSSKSHNNKKLFENYPWECCSCDVICSALPALRTHYQEVHDEPPKFRCVKCLKIYTRYRSFARHVKLHVDRKRFSCDVCGKCFSQKTVLQSHMTVHSEERPHVCPQCGKAFKQFSSLYLHSRCHLPEQAKPKYPCAVCFKLFSSKHTVDNHMKIHTGERNFICDICGKRFIAKGSLDYHILAHNDAKPHSCQACGKCFKTARLLAKHSSVHSGVKPYQCDVCGKQFRERGALKEHNRIHTGAMPYSCEYCGKNFRFKGILTVHRRQHTGERPYSCRDCRRDFTNWANYNKHMKRRHKGVPSPVAQVQVPQTAPPPNQQAASTPRTPEVEVIVTVNEADHPPPPAYIEPLLQEPPPPYKMPAFMDDDIFRIQPSNYPSPIHMAYYIHPLQGFVQRIE